MKRRTAGGVLLACVMGGLLLEFVGHTRVWQYPSYIISDDASNISPFWCIKLFIAALATITALAFFARDKDNPWSITGIALVWVVSLSLFYLIRPREIRTLIPLYAKDCIVAMYVLVCWGVAEWLKAHMRPWTVSCVAFCIAHVLLVVYCGWAKGLGAFVFSPPTVLWMALAFAIVYTVEFWYTLQWMTLWERMALYAGLLVAHLVFFTPERLGMIIQTIGSGDAPHWNGEGVSWWMYRLSVLKAHLTGVYPPTIQDPLALGWIVYIPLVWLGIAFDTQLYQLIYVALVLLSLAAMWWLFMDSNHYQSDLLAFGVLMSNIWGLICNVNLFWSSRVGPLTSVNVFQLVPLTLLIVWALSPEVDRSFEDVEAGFSGAMPEGSAGVHTGAVWEAAPVRAEAQHGEKVVPMPMDAPEPALDAELAPTQPKAPLGHDGEEAAS